MIKGSKQCVEGAKQRIDEIVEDLVSDRTIFWGTLSSKFCFMYTV
jgi:hypothetical protein